MFCPVATLAQTGGENTFQFLDLDFNARSLALGGDFIQLRDGDINLAVANPASIQESMHKNIALNHFFYPAGINYGQLAYGHKFKKTGTFTAHMRYAAYGRFTHMDYTGQELGTFTAGDYVMGVGYAHPIGKKLSIGANVNSIFSRYESYGAWGLGADVAAMFSDDEKTNINAVILARNIGWQINGYTKGNHEMLPVEVLAGISYKFHHAPFRLGIVGTDLTQWDLTYNDPTLQPTIDQLTGDTIPVPTASFIKKLAYHTNFSLEIVPNKNLFFRIGFNYQRRAALGIIDRMGAGGFTFGLGIRVKKFCFNYGLALYSAAGVSNAIGITTNFSEFTRKQKPAAE
jgi:hypothetical protein